VLLIFSDVHCGPCEHLAPQLARLQRNAGKNGTQVIVVGRGDAEENRLKPLEYGWNFPVVVQKQWEISRQYGIFATPVAFLIDEEGRIAKPVARGPEEILVDPGRSWYWRKTRSTGMQYNSRLLALVEAQDRLWSRRAWLRASGNIALLGTFGGCLLKGDELLKQIRIRSFERPATTVSEVVDYLRSAWGAPVSIIEAPHDATFPINMGQTTAYEVLGRAVSSDRSYRMRQENGRTVLVPVEWKGLDDTVSGVAIKDMARAEATRHYIEFAKPQTSALAPVEGPVLKGDPGAPVYAEKVTLSSSATVFQHLVQLLGSDARVVFSIRLARPGVYIFLLQNVIVPGKEVPHERKQLLR
jgi:hypothetical protein